LIDDDNNGEISLEELKIILMKNDPRLSTEKVQVMIESLKMNKSSKIKYSDWIVANLDLNSLLTP